MPKAPRRRASGRRLRRGRYAASSWQRYRSRVRRTGSTPYDVGTMDDIRRQWQSYRRRFGRSAMFRAWRDAVRWIRRRRRYMQRNTWSYARSENAPPTPANPNPGGFGLGGGTVYVAPPGSYARYFSQL